MELSEMHGLLHEIRSVYPLSDYRLILEFENDEYRVANIKPIVDQGGVFVPLRDPDVFRTVKIGESGTIEWDNGVDLDPDVLFARSVALVIPSI